MNQEDGFKRMNNGKSKILQMNDDLQYKMEDDQIGKIIRSENISSKI